MAASPSRGHDADDAAEREAELMAQAIYDARDTLRAPEELRCPDCVRNPVISQVYIWRDATKYLWFPGQRALHAIHGLHHFPAVAYPLREDTRVLESSNCRRCRSVFTHSWDGQRLRVARLPAGTRAQIQP